jgi:hypothetical protein
MTLSRSNRRPEGQEVPRVAAESVTSEAFSHGRPLRGRRRTFWVGIRVIRAIRG